MGTHGRSRCLELVVGVLNKPHGAEPSFAMIAENLLATRGLVIRNGCLREMLRMVLKRCALVTKECRGEQRRVILEQGVEGDETIGLGELNRVFKFGYVASMISALDFIQVRLRSDLVLMHSTRGELTLLDESRTRSSEFAYSCILTAVLVHLNKRCSGAYGDHEVRKDLVDVPIEVDRAVSLSLRSGEKLSSKPTYLLTFPHWMRSRSYV